MATYEHLEHLEGTKVSTFEGKERIGDPMRAAYWRRKREAVNQCGILERYVCPECGAVHGKVVRSCHDRFCPWCQTHRQAAFLERLNGALDSLPAYQLMRVVATVPHSASEALSTVFDRLHVALRRMQDRRPWKEIRGSVVSIEITRGNGRRGMGRRNGDNGWHVHAHLLCLLPEEWTPAEISAWKASWVEAWLALVPGAEAAAQDLALIDRAELVEVVKYGLKADSFLLDGAGLALPPEASAALVLEVQDVLRKRRMIRTSGALYRMPTADMESEEEIDEDTTDPTPACHQCGNETLEAVSRGHGFAVVARWLTLPYPGDARGWYILAPWSLIKPEWADRNRPIGEDP